jgi:ATP-binding cassette subfamily F protein 3
LSFGQRARLLLARLVAQGANFLVLDEPVNHLDIPSREQFEKALDAFKGGILLVAHDRAFIARTCNRLWELKDAAIRDSVPPKEWLREEI